MSAKVTDENGIQPEFSFCYQSEDASVDIENNSSIAGQARFGEIGLEVVEIAFSQLYERYRIPIYLIACRIVRNSEDAQDATQEIAYKLYRSLHLWDVHKSRLSTWIYKMAVNHSIDCHRALRRRKECQLPEKSSDQVSHFEIPDCSARSPLSELENKEQIDAVLQCAGTLPDLQRQILIHRYFGERKLEEIADMVQCNLGTVKSALHRATYAVRHFLRRSGALPSESA